MDWGDNILFKLATCLNQLHIDSHQLHNDSHQLHNDSHQLQNDLHIIIVRLSLLTMTNLNHMREYLQDELSVFLFFPLLPLLL